jgi:hypothetical protein
VILCFELTMPSRNSWNGRWSGENKRFIKIVNLGRTQKAAAKLAKILNDGPYRYSFGDGWVARVSVEAVDAVMARKLRKLSSGFCGYDWMVDSILDHGDIRTRETANT